MRKLSKHERLGTVVVGYNASGTAMGVIVCVENGGAFVNGFRSNGAPIVDWYNAGNLRKASPLIVGWYNSHKAQLDGEESLAVESLAVESLAVESLAVESLAVESAVEDMPDASGISALRDALASATGAELNTFTPKVPRRAHESDAEYRGRVVDHFASDLRAVQVWIEDAALKAPTSPAVASEDAQATVVGTRRLHIDCGSVRVVQILSVSGSYALTSGGRVWLADTQPLTSQGFDVARTAQDKAGINADPGDFVLIIGLGGAVKSGLSNGGRDRNKLVLCKAPIGAVVV